MIVYFCVLSAAAFALFYAYDWCSVKKPESSLMKWGFYAACLLTLVSTVGTAVECNISIPQTMLSSVGLIVSVIGFVFLVKALFFSLPKGTYSDPTAPRTVFNEGLYGLCRHPGFPAFAVFYIGLMLWLGKQSIVPYSELIILNFLYIVMQDLWTFPKIFCDYETYRKEVPFMFPGVKEIRKEWRRMKEKNSRSR